MQTANTNEQFHLLIGGLRGGEPWAAEELYRSYAPLLRAIVRRRLHPELRTRFDSLDFVQEVWVSFLAFPPERYAFKTPDALRQFLTQVAINKVGEVHRQRFDTEKHDIRRELPLGDHPEGISAFPPVSREPTPSQFLMAVEQWERLLTRFPVGHHAVLTRLREGHTYEDIARMTGVSQSTVKRIVCRLKEITGL